MLRIGYIGNFGPAHSTENHVRQALEGLGHQVVQYQEDQAASWDELAQLRERLDVVLWTRTWHLPQFDQLGTLEALELAGVPTIGYHLDRWWGLDREHQVYDEPFFRCALVVTADGDPRHQQLFAEAGVNHRWLPPAVDEHEALRVGVYDRQFQRPVAFVGSHGSYHGEWPYRLELITWLRQNFRGQLGLWPRSRSIRGQELANLYMTARVVVGDSCLAGGITHYWSDRIPETLGRGGFLIHPEVEGLADHFTLRGPDTQLVTYRLGDWDELRRLIRYYLAHPAEARQIAQAGREHVLAHHTYRHRMETLLGWARDEYGVGSVAFRAGPVTVEAPGGVTGQFDLREGSTDGAIVDEVWTDACYQLDGLVNVAGGVVVDVGANIGAFSVWAAKAGAAKVHAYEVDVANAHRLADNLELNGVADRVQVFREAVWNSEHRQLWVGDGTAGSGSIQTLESSPSMMAEVVEARDLDSVLLRAGDRIRLLKLDCETCEFPALLGLDPVHLARVEHLVMEFHGPGMKHLEMPGGYSLGAMVELLAEYGAVRIVGRPSQGGMLWWRRYGA